MEQALKRIKSHSIKRDKPHRRTKSLEITKEDAHNMLNQSEGVVETSRSGVKENKERDWRYWEKDFLAGLEQPPP